MKKISLTIFLLTSVFGYSQSKNINLTGKVFHESTPLKDINILNLNVKTGTKSRNDGTFYLAVNIKDTIQFSAINYKNRKIIITEDHLTNKTMFVYLEPEVHELEEVLLQNKKKFVIDRFHIPKNLQLNIDNSDRTKPPDASKLTDPNVPLGIDFIAIYKMLTYKKRLRKLDKKLQDQKDYEAKAQFPGKLKQTLGDDFFIKELKISENQVDQFLDYCVDNGLKNLYKSTKILVLDFLVKQNAEFKKHLKEQ